MEYTIPKSELPPAPGDRNVYVKTFASTNCTGSNWTTDLATYANVITQGPIAVNDTFSTTKNTSVNGNVLSNDRVNASIDDSVITTAKLVDDVDIEKGTLTFNENGTFTFVPATDFAGNATFTYNVPYVGFGLDNPKDSNLATVTVIVSELEPKHTPGISSGPNGGDGNNDGIPDSEQPNVTSFVNDLTGRYVVLEAADDVCEITSASMKDVSSNTSQDTGFTYANGMMDFTLDCGTPGYTTTVTQYYYGVDGDHFVVRKYNPVTNTYRTIDSATIDHTTIDGQAVTTASYQITDGGELDIDGEANGVIVDPAGLATSTGGLAATGQNFVLIVTAAVVLIAVALGGTFYAKHRSALR